MAKKYLKCPRCGYKIPPKLAENYGADCPNCGLGVDLIKELWNKK